MNAYSNFPKELIRIRRNFRAQKPVLFCEKCREVLAEVIYTVKDKKEHSYLKGLREF